MVRISVLNLKRILSNKVYWLSVLAALMLLLCSVIYTDIHSGEKYIFISLFYDKSLREVLKLEGISMSNVLLGYDAGYFWMFCPIIAGIPCVLAGRIERFVLFRTSKNKFIVSKYLTVLVLGGMIFLIAYLIFALISMILMQENLLDMNLAKKLLSVFIWGIYSAIPAVVLSELVKNKYLILCIPFVINYFMCMFLGSIFSYEAVSYILPYTYQILLLLENKRIMVCVGILIMLIAFCGILKKIFLEGRCDCGQQ